MPTFTTAALVKSRLVKRNTTTTDGEISGFIDDCEGHIKAVMKGNLPATFDPAKHGILRKLATDMAAFKLLTADPSSFTTVIEAQAIGDFLWTEIETALNLLSDTTVQEYLKNE